MRKEYTNICDVSGKLQKIVVDYDDSSTTEGTEYSKIKFTCPKKDVLNDTCKRQNCTVYQKAPETIDPL